MSSFTGKYYQHLFSIAGSIRATNKEGGKLDFTVAVEEVIGLIRSLASGDKLMFIGNGGSAAISSHMAVDFWKNGGIRAVAFNDTSQLTCVANDCGYENVFEKPIEMFADHSDILFAISCSGRSENVLRGVLAARAKGCRVVTLSGFDADNPLSSLGDYNFYVPSKSYGPVEVIHHSLCHCLLDAILKTKNG